MMNKSIEYSAGGAGVFTGHDLIYYLALSFSTLHTVNGSIELQSCCYFWSKFKGVEALRSETVGR